MIRQPKGPGFPALLGQTQIGVVLHAVPAGYSAREVNICDRARGTHAVIQVIHQHARCRLRPRPRAPAFLILGAGALAFIPAQQALRQLPASYTGSAIDSGQRRTGPPITLVSVNIFRSLWIEIIILNGINRAAGYGRFPYLSIDCTYL